MSLELLLDLFLHHHLFFYIFILFLFYNLKFRSYFFTFIGVNHDTMVRSTKSYFIFNYPNVIHLFYYNNRVLHYNIEEICAGQTWT